MKDQSKVIECPDCGGVVSNSANACPHCGRKFVKKGGELASFFCGLMFGPLGVIVAYFCYKGRGAFYSLLAFVFDIVVALLLILIFN